MAQRVLQAVVRLEYALKVLGRTKNRPFCTMNVPDCTRFHGFSGGGGGAGAGAGRAYDGDGVGLGAGFGDVAIGLDVW